MACQGYDYFETGKVPNYKHLQISVKGIASRSRALQGSPPEPERNYR
jgi:hypothetical protein